MKLIFILILTMTTAFSQKVIAVKWDTKHAAPPSRITRDNPRFAAMLRLGFSSIPEPLVMQFAGYGGKKLGLKAHQAKTLQDAIASYYQKMSKQTKNGDFPVIPSALSYCYSKEKPTHGLATVYLPKLITDETKTILFLHGYGGSFSYYLHYIATTFPDTIVICPAYGVTPANAPDDYFAECYRAVEKKTNHSPAKNNKPILVGLSAGGTKGFRYYSRNTDRYARFICLASLPPQKFSKPPADTSVIRLIAGGSEYYVKNKLLNRRIKLLKLQNYRQTILKNQGHFFMLTDEENTRKALKLYYHN